MFIGIFMVSWLGFLFIHVVSKTWWEFTVTYHTRPNRLFLIVGFLSGLTIFYLFPESSPSLGAKLFAGAGGFVFGIASGFWAIVIMDAFRRQQV